MLVNNITRTCGIYHINFEGRLMLTPTIFQPVAACATLGHIDMTICGRRACFSALAISFTPVKRARPGSEKAA